MSKLTNAIDELVQFGILQKGVKDNRYVVIARKETYLKTSPATIRGNTDMLNYLQSIGVDIDTYEHAYLSSPLPMNMELTASAVNLIISDDDYLEYCHLFNDARIHKEMEERLSKNIIQYRISFGRKQYYMPPLSQVVEEDNLNIENSQQYDGDQTPTNNNENNIGDNHSDNNNGLLPTLLSLPHRSVNNPSSNTISSHSKNSSLSSDILNTNNTTEPQNNNSVDQTTESDNHLRNQFSPSVDDIMNQLTNMLDDDPLNSEQSGSTSNMTENVLDDSKSSYRNELETNNQKQNQNRSVLTNIGLLLNNNNNNNTDNIVLPTESTSNDTAAFLENMSSQQTLELISNLFQNKKHLLKRILDGENNDVSPKRSRNNENGEVTSPFVDMNLNGSLSSTPVGTESNNTIGDSQIDDEDLHEAYQKIILTDAIIMSQSDICNKLKHVKNISKSRDNIISKLVTDELLIKGNWFATKNVNGSINLLPGFLKAFPKNNPQGQLGFARSLAKYKIHYKDYEESFKKNKTDAFPRTLTGADVKHKTWLFSNVLSDYIQKNDFLNERIIFDPSTIIQENNTPLMAIKRIRKSKQRYSPSDNKK